MDIQRVDWERSPERERGEVDTFTYPAINTGQLYQTPSGQRPAAGAHLPLSLVPRCVDYIVIWGY